MEQHLLPIIPLLLIVTIMFINGIVSLVLLYSIVIDKYYKNLIFQSVLGLFKQRIGNEFDILIIPTITYTFIHLILMNIDNYDIFVIYVHFKIMNKPIVNDKIRICHAHYYIITHYFNTCKNK